MESDQETERGSKRSQSVARMGGRAQIDSEAIDAAGPKEIAKAFEMKETEISKRVIGHRICRGKREQYQELKRGKYRGSR